MNFADAYALEIGQHVEKKGKFSYLSWCYAVKFLRENFPSAVWNVCENDNGLPLFSMDNSHFVKVKLSLGEGNGVFTQWHPVLDNNNKPIAAPTSFHINTSIQRCLTKCIAVATGIGLGVYAGEDLPVDEDAPKNGSKQAFVPNTEKISAQQLSEIRDKILSSKTLNETDVCRRGMLTQLEDLPVARYKGLTNWIDGVIATETVIGAEA